MKPGSIAPFLLALLLVASPAWSAQPADEEDEQPHSDAPDEARAGKSDDDDGPIDSGVTERVVVSASATVAEKLDAPAAVDVIEGKDLQDRPSDHLADQLRRVPGINVVQFSARDVNIASRSASGGINNSTLALSDGRTLYQDFLGFVMWEFAPTDAELVDRVEVVRGPASSLWGANAVGGLVHVITKSPRETLGGRLTLEAGSYDSRKVELRQSFLAGPWALRVSGGFFEQDPFDRPQTIENFFGETIDPDLGLIEGDIRDSGTRQPRLDLRADWEGGDGSRWILQGGWARTRGWIATGLGPFDVDPSTSSSYLQARYGKGSFEAQVDVNYFDGDGLNLINAISFSFTSGRTHASFRGRSLLGKRAVIGWGAELERSNYDLSIAPNADERTIGSTFAELDLKLAPKWKLITGARLDHFKETIGTVLSPRAALRYKPRRNHTLRAAWGKAFRSPSVLEEYLLVPSIPVAILDWEQIDQDEVGFPFFTVMAEFACSMQPDNCGVPAGEIPDYIAVTAASGSLDLQEEETSSLEIGYAASFKRFDVSATVYRTRSSNGIDFPQKLSYGSGPDGIPVTADDVVLPSDPDGDGIDEAPPVDLCPVGLGNFPEFRTACMQGPVPYNQAISIFLDGLIPALFQYDNGSRLKNQGVELGGSWRGPKGLSVSLNYSWQDVPRSDGVSMDDRIENVLLESQLGQDLDGDGLVADTAEFVNIPAEQRVSLSVQLERPRWFGSLSYDYLDETFWQDVLTSDFWGWVPDYTLVGLRGGWKWPGRGLQLTAQVTNLLDEDIQQHIYGDLIDRRASLALTWSWANGGGFPADEN